MSLGTEAFIFIWHYMWKNWLSLIIKSVLSIIFYGNFYISLHFSGAAISAISCCQGTWWLYKSSISLLQSLLLQFGTIFLNTNLPLPTFHNRSVDQVKWIFLLWHSFGMLFQFEYIECVELACIDCSCHTWMDLWCNVSCWIWMIINICIR